MHNRGFVEYLERGSKVVLRHSVRRPPGGRGYYGGVSLRQHVLPVSRTTRRKMVRDSYGIPSGRRSSNGPIKGQGVVREMVRVSEWACISSISPMYLTLHHMPFRDIEDELPLRAHVLSP